VAQREEDWAEKQRLLQGIVINMAPQKKKMKVSGMWKTKGTSLQSCPAQINKINRLFIYACLILCL
jgi:murein endopeptidase